jgi:hypothetical protein
MFGKISKNNTTSPVTSTQIISPMMMVLKRQPQRHTQMPIHKPPFNQNKITYAESDGHKMRWGKPTWRFFHTLAYKIKPEAFPLIRTQTLQIIMNICASLPCPMCSSHATEYMRKINLNSIQTKNDFIELFFTFHNAVNERKRYRLFNMDMMDASYSNASLIDAYNEFMYYYADKQKGFRLMTDNMVRAQNLQIIKSWFQHILPYTAT